MQCFYIVDIELTTFSWKNFIRYFEATSCNIPIRSECQNDICRVQNQCIWNLRATIFVVKIRICRYLYKQSQWLSVIYYVPHYIAIN